MRERENDCLAQFLRPNTFKLYRAILDLCLTTSVSTDVLCLLKGTLVNSTVCTYLQIATVICRNFGDNFHHFCDSVFSSHPKGNDRFMATTTNAAVNVIIGNATFFTHKHMYVHTHTHTHTRHSCHLLLLNFVPIWIFMNYSAIRMIGLSENSNYIDRPTFPFLLFSFYHFRFSALAMDILII